MTLHVSQTRGCSYANNDESTENVVFHRNQTSFGYGNNEIYVEDDEEEEEIGEGNANTPLIFNSEEDGDFPKARTVFGFMGFLGFAVVYAMRVNLSVAIVAMVNQSAIPHVNISTTIDETCSADNKKNMTILTEGEFAWDESTQGLVLGSFFYGYVLTQVPGGRVAEIVGGKLIYGYGVLFTAIFTILTPIAAYWNLTFLIIVRVLEGMGEGVTYPAMHAMLAYWIPPLERNKFAAIVYAGSNIGTVISLPLSGWLCSLKFLGGWPLSFYLFGALGLIWFIFWMFLVYDKPSMHPRISSKERIYIENSMHLLRLPGRRFSNIDTITHVPTHSIPWCSILTSTPLWAILITQCGQSWAFYTQLTELPTYMSNILHYDIESNALLNAVPYLTSWIMGIACSALADWMLRKRYISLLNSYKLWNSIASIVPSLGLIGIGYVGCSWEWVTFMLAGVGSFAGAIYAGNQMNHISLSPRYAGTMYGITNSAANICGFLAPYIIGLIINHNETLPQWHIVFLLAAYLNIGGNVIYLLFASAEEQKWSICQSERERERERSANNREEIQT
uniref:Major facilitator superfamily (MFS) profile domain-containing protein n=1 Tax=Glossina brevipalpis TaxID=37001 RepID=A0A1A9WA66_9MUSC